MKVSKEELDKIVAMFDKEDIVYINLDKYKKLDGAPLDGQEDNLVEKNKMKEKRYGKNSNK